MHSFDVYIDNTFAETVYAQNRTSAWAEIGKSGLYVEYNIKTLSERVARVQVVWTK
jgi:hypothetical protein